MSQPDPSLFAWQESFEEICSFTDKHVEPTLAKLSQSKELSALLSTLFFQSPSSPSIKEWFEELLSLNSIDAFQSWIEQRIFPIIESSYQSLNIEGIEQLDPGQAYIFISNHRDIVMDPLLLNLALKQQGLSTAHCAIGDNLLVSEQANALARLNLCFKVIRSVKSPKAILKAMKVQSAYIAYQHFAEKNHIWIAQKEGRSKDNVDKTNPALIKMLGLNRPKEMSHGAYFNALNIVPVCYSYEWDPCDIEKAQQLEDKHNPDYVKSHHDDLLAVQKGLSGQKGQIHIRFGQPIHDEAVTLTHTDIAEQIDHFIKTHYQLYPVNYAAYKKLYPTETISSPFDKQEINTAWKTLESRMMKESDTIKKRVLNAYAAPLFN